MTTVYNVHTDLPPELLDEVGRMIFKMWVDFALGNASIGGHTLDHPTGRYASSIEYKRYGKSRISIQTDDEMAPEAEWIENGHGAIDYKVRFPGRTFPMHRGAEDHYGSAGYGDPVLSGSRRKSIWATVRASGFAGFATVPTEVTAENQNSWIIPAMPAYSPAFHLSELIRNSASSGQWVVSRTG